MSAKPKGRERPLANPGLTCDEETTLEAVVRGVAQATHRVLHKQNVFMPDNECGLPATPADLIFELPDGKSLVGFEVDVSYSSRTLVNTLAVLAIVRVLAFDFAVEIA